jgi:hypothetical protein
MLASTSRAVSRVLATRASPFVGSMTQARTYHDNIVEHYENPRNVGSLDKNDISVGTVRVFVSSCCGSLVNTCCYTFVLQPIFVFSAAKLSFESFR